MPLTFTISILQFGSTAWYRVQTPDFYLFELTLIQEYGKEHKVPDAFTIINGQSDSRDKEVVRLALDAIDKWMQENTDIYEVE